MATLHVCAVFDVKAEAFGRPMFVPSVGLAIRAFIDECKNPESQMCKYRQDFSLYEIALFDDERAEFTPVGNPQKLLLEGSATADM